MLQVLVIPKEPKLPYDGDGRIRVCHIWQGHGDFAVMVIPEALKVLDEGLPDDLLHSGMGCDREQLYVCLGTCRDGGGSGRSPGKSGLHVYHDLMRGRAAR